MHLFGGKKEKSSYKFSCWAHRAQRKPFTDLTVITLMHFAFLNLHSTLSCSLESTFIYTARSVAPCYRCFLPQHFDPRRWAEDKSSNTFPVLWYALSLSSETNWSSICFKAPSHLLYDLSAFFSLIQNYIWRNLQGICAYSSSHSPSVAWSIVWDLGESCWGTGTLVLEMWDDMLRMEGSWSTGWQYHLCILHRWTI